MAPVLKILIQWLPSLTNIPEKSSQFNPTHALPVAVDITSDGLHDQQQLIGLIQTEHSNVRVADTLDSHISSVSWASQRLDVFGKEGNNLVHKYWDGYQWNPSGSKLETLGNGIATPPVAITWGVDRLDVFSLDDHNVIKHQYWDGVAWRPNDDQFENLGGQCDPHYAIAASTWGPNRLDVFCRGPKGDLLHQYYDGSQWQPSQGSLESLGGNLSTGPSVLSWGKDRLDIFALNPAGDVVHLYWDGNQWSQWETFEASLKFPLEPVTVKAWSENRLDIYAVSAEGSLWHKYWDGYQWASWEQLGKPDTPLTGSVGVSSWAPGRIDIVGRSNATGHYWYKYYDGQSWQPDVLGWYDKGPQGGLASNPSVVSWAVNRLDIFGVSSDGVLRHQAWVGTDWYPGSYQWECLAHCSNL